MLKTEDQAHGWLRSTFHVSRETMAAVETLAALVQSENQEQNLISGATMRQIWVRHIADSAQILCHLDSGKDGEVLDIGSGAGFPGLVIAALHAAPVTLVEPRRLRADFLHRAAEAMNIRPTIIAAKVQALPPRSYGVITARAVASLTELLRLAHPFSTEKTRLIFPKGRSAQSELDEAKAAWQGNFRMEPSLTDPDARIVIVDGVRGPRGAAKAGSKAR